MKSTSKKVILTFIYLVAFVFTIDVKAQFWTEDFVPTNLVPGGEANGYAGANPGAWSVTALAGNTGSNANIWYISCEEASMMPNNCGSTCSGGPFPPPTPLIGQSLHIGTSAGDLGALYLETGFGFTDTELRAESPAISCVGQTNITLSFNYIEFGETSNDNAQVWYFDGVAWSLLADMPKTLCGDASGPCNTLPCSGVEQGYWTAFSIALPASADNNPNVKIGFYWKNIDDGIATDPSIAIGRIELTSPTSSNSITAGNLVGPFCAGDSNIGLPFQSTGTFTAGNVYTAQLSDASGSFASPVDLGTFPSTANVGNISLTIPANTPAGAGYLIQIISSSPAATSTSIGPFTINAPVPLSVTVTPNPGLSICPGQCVTFNTSVTNGGATPTYQWQINGVNAPAPSTNDSLVDCTLQNGDEVTVIVTSSLTCVSNSPDTSAVATITYVSSQPLSVNLTTVPSPLTICAGDPIQLDAVPTNGGSAPTYVWTVNDIVVPGFNTSNFTYSGAPVPVVDQTEVCVIVTSSLVGCVTNSPDTVCAVVTVLPTISPIVTITADVDTICAGGTVNFTSAITNGGANPTYQWFINTTAVPAPFGTGSTFNSSSLNDGDVVSLQIVSSSQCASNPNASSNSIPITVLPYETPAVSIISTAGICPGQLVQFISSTTGGGSSPQFLWYVNGTNLIGTLANLTVNAAIFNDDDTLSCTMISNYACLNSDTAFSNNLIIQTLSPATIDAGPDVSILYGESFKTDPTINGLESQGIYLWAPDSTLSCNTCLNPIATPTLTTDYVVSYTNPNGCVARDTLRIEVKPNYEVFIPTGFSPNADNINDVFYVRGPFIRSVNMKIWDRFGGLIFESPYSNYGWDGTKQYKDINTGVYVYYISVEFLDGVTKDFKGNITLSR